MKNEIMEELQIVTDKFAAANVELKPALRSVEDRVYFDCVASVANAIDNNKWI